MKTASLTAVARRFISRNERPAPEAVAAVVAEQEDDALCSPAVMRALALASEFERPGAEDDRPRRLIMIPGAGLPFDAREDATAALQQRFPDKLTTPSQAEVAARFLREVLRERRRQRRRPSFATNW